MLLLLISLLAGALTILAPCVLPLLPVIIGGSVSGTSTQKGRPYVIALALAVSIIGFTLLLKVSTALVNLSPNVLAYISGGLLVALGVVSIFPRLWERLIIRLNWEALSLRFLGRSQQHGGKYAGPVLIGVALGPVFSSCSPTYAFILASVLPRSFLSGLIYLVAYSLALVLALLCVSLLGRRFISKLNWAVDTHGLFRRVIGIVFVAIGLIFISGQQVTLETWIGNHLPFDETRLEQVLLSTQHRSIASKLNERTSRSSVLNVQPTAAPALQGLTSWINSPPLQLSNLKGKVVLVDFWTYSCVNCNRALPYIEKWYQAYHQQGLDIIGIHTPEFAFEHDPTNVQAAVKADRIAYPVALDNDYDTWNAFENDSWPADYLIDKSGKIRYISLGEGGYQVTEEAIQQLLGVDQTLRTPTSNVPVLPSQTPETYFGTNRVSGYSGSPAVENGSATFKASSQLSLNSWTLSGAWQVGDQAITSQSSSSTLTFKVEARDVYVVAGSANNQSEAVTVGLPEAMAGQYGSDASTGTVMISGSRLYNIVSLKQFGTTTVTLTVPKGVTLYTFTFGS